MTEQVFETKAEAVKQAERKKDPKTVKLPQSTVPTGIFPVPKFIRHWAGLA